MTDDRQARIDATAREIFVALVLDGGQGGYDECHWARVAYDSAETLEAERQRRVGVKQAYAELHMSALDAAFRAWAETDPNRSPIIAAIKTYRDLTNCTLAEAKNLIETEAVRRGLR